MPAPQSWLQIAIEVDPELAEAVAEVLARHLPGGVVIESTGVNADAGQGGVAIGPLLVSAYIQADEKLEETRAQIEQGLRYLALIQPVPEPSYRPIAEQNWMEAWKVHYRPLKVGKKLLVLPAWAEAPESERELIRIEPGMAFGTGVHPTTQLSLQLLEKYLEPGEDVIDMGTGSGILAIAARRLGAGSVLGVDIDAEAIANARLNARLNDMDLPLEAGSLDGVLSGDHHIKQGDVVLANILAPMLVRLLNEGLARLLARGGWMLFSGILEEQHSDIRAALDQAGLQEIELIRMGDWLGLAARTKN